MLMHKLLVAYPRVDHIDGNGLNNQQMNLRPANESQNGANARKAPGFTSQYKGVYLVRRSQKWCAQIRVARLVRVLGTFDSEDEAALAYNAAAVEAWGDFALLNEVEKR
jgi:hypothetical protein